MNALNALNAWKASKALKTKKGLRMVVMEFGSEDRLEFAGVPALRKCIRSVSGPSKKIPGQKEILGWNSNENKGPKISLAGMERLQVGVLNFKISYRRCINGNLSAPKFPTSLNFKGRSCQ